MRGYHFLRGDWSAGHGHEPAWHIGETRTLEVGLAKPIHLCERGYHASHAWYDALENAPGPIGCIVEIPHVYGEDKNRFPTKFVGAQRTLIFGKDCSVPLRVFATDTAAIMLSSLKLAGISIEKSMLDAMVKAIETAQMNVKVPDSRPDVWFDLRTVTIPIRYRGDPEFTLSDDSPLYKLYSTEADMASAYVNGNFPRRDSVFRYIATQMVACAVAVIVNLFGANSAHVAKDAAACFLSLEFHRLGSKYDAETFYSDGFYSAERVRLAKLIDLLFEGDLFQEKRANG